ncbi:Uncharacterized protein TCAP_00713 [Tolypocladium capitatum]|uniref:MOSC domain-containing protein n=1 Tax=Tolypocladium capitatum TaxID=45235 RepID=A0A2K3QP95_9HYPO|nr:Uncharacterized protein TCAP_00713 [Tolypocladium capitatum]
MGGDSLHQGKRVSLRIYVITITINVAAKDAASIEDRLFSIAPGTMTFSGGALAQFGHGSVLLLVVTIVVFLVPVFIIFSPLPVGRSDALRQTHSKLGVRSRSSNLRTQYSPIHQPQDGQPAKIQSLYIYPIKSCRGIELSRTKVLPHGFEHDRLYTFAQLKPKHRVAPTADADGAEENAWEILTLRLIPLLANVKVDIWLPDAGKTDRRLGKLEGGVIVARFPWTDKGLRGLVQLATAKLSRGLNAVPQGAFVLPLEFPSEEDITARGYEFANVKVWKDAPYALNMQGELPPELARYLGVEHQLGLFRMDPANQRRVFRCAPPSDALGYQPVIDFQDGHPLHMLSLTSIRALESKIQRDQFIQRLDARRFRANIILSGAGEYDEDHWKSVQFKRMDGRDAGDEVPSVFDVSCRTVRCKLPNVDPATGIRHEVEPDRALRKYREIDEAAPKAGCLGVQLCPVFQEAGGPDHLQSFLEVGMDVDVFQRGSHSSLGPRTGRSGG